MIKLEEKASWLWELEDNDLFSRGDFDVDIVFEHQWQSDPSNGFSALG